MKKLILIIFLIAGMGMTSAQGVLVLHHDTTYTTSLAKRIADRDSLFVAVNQLLSTYTVMMFDTSSSLTGLNQYNSIILQETSFDVINARYLGVGARDSLKAWLSGGTSTNKRTLISIGADQGYNYSRSGSAARDLGFAADRMKFNYRLDNGNNTSFNSITGIGVDVGNTRSYTTSPIGSGFWPDGVEPLSGATVLYHYTGRGTTDSVASVGVVDTGYIGISFFLDPRYFTNGNFYHALNELMIYAMANGGNFPGFIPVELVSFSATSVGANVNLAWVTASELNNSGFEIERLSGESGWQTIAFVPGYGTTAEQKFYSYTDTKLQNGLYQYRLKQIDHNGTFEYSPVVEVDVNVPVEFSLHQNYPNPFNPSTRISFGLAADSKVSLKIFNILGQEIATLINGTLSAGSHEVDFKGTNLTSGVYLYRLDASGVDGSVYSSVKKMILSK